MSQNGESNSNQSELKLKRLPSQIKNIDTKKIRLVSINDCIKSFEFPDDITEVTIGRSPDCKVWINNGFVSRVHCKIVVDENVYILHDLSFNGTYVNGKIVGKDKKKVLKHLDTIRIVENEFLFYCGNSKIQDYISEEIAKLYEVKEELGSGTSAVVRKGINRSTGECCAIKIIKKQKWLKQKTKEQILREVEILKRVNHPNIIKYEDIVDSDRYLYIILELVKGGDLFEKLEDGPIEEDEARNIFIQILRAVEYLHSIGIVHRDLKPENILIDEDKGIKITDFGLARITHSQNLVTLCGTPYYLAPEIIKLGSKYTTNGYTLQVDMWSLGVILYTILSGTLPFTDELTRNMSLYEQIETGSYDFTDIIWNDISDDAVDLIKKLLTVSPEERITATEALKHPWIINDDSKKRKIEHIWSKVKNESKNVANDIHPQSNKKRKYEESLGTKISKMDIKCEDCKENVPPNNINNIKKNHIVDNHFVYKDLMPINNIKISQ